MVFSGLFKLKKKISLEPNKASLAKSTSLEWTICGNMAKHFTNLLKILEIASKDFNIVHIIFEILTASFSKYDRKITHSSCLPFLQNSKILLRLILN